MARGRRASVVGEPNPQVLERELRRHDRAWSRFREQALVWRYKERVEPAVGPAILELAVTMFFGCLFILASLSARHGGDSQGILVVSGLMGSGMVLWGTFQAVRDVRRGRRFQRAKKLNAEARQVLVERIDKLKGRSGGRTLDKDLLS